MNGLKSFLFGMVCLLTLAACNKKKSSAGSIFDGTVVFYDDFNRADGALGSDWNGYFSTGSIAIVNQMAQIDSSGSFNQFATYGTAVDSSAYAVTAKFTVDGGTLDPDSSMIVFGNLNTNNIISSTEYVVCGFFGTQRKITILTSNEGFVEEGLVEFDFADATNLSVALVNDGANGLSCIVSDGTHSETITYTMTIPEIGQHVGFGGGDSNGIVKVNVDDFTVTSLE